ncbi:hypothetical protein Taro_055619 [Colocasia esculenta]|uniref:Protein kinase domain-containing protein n=1 Tax=Colocasia esculenta TaxID=4460 RepID=A0A843XRS6_COLES|nr:hypothetical protein [Colocasia esculenta]
MAIGYVIAIHWITFSEDVPEFPYNLSDDARDFLARGLSRDPRKRWSAEELLSHSFLKLIEMAIGYVIAIHRITFSEDVPEFPYNLSDDARDFLARGLSRDPRKRWSAEELLSHSFLKRSGEFPKECSPKSTRSGSGLLGFMVRGGGTGLPR